MTQAECAAAEIPPLTKGRYRLRQACCAEDLRKVQRLRFRAFRAGGAEPENGLDRDSFDPLCLHGLVEDRASAEPVCCFRLMLLPDGAAIGRSYAAARYDLGALQGFPGRVAELGRFCVHPDRYDPDILRLAWGALTGFVDRFGVRLLFGCTSFPGTDPDPYGDSFALLRARHLAPARWRPGVGAAEVHAFGQCPGNQTDARRGWSAMPPLLRTYLLMGGWVSDHAVIDRDLGTLHVFTGLETHRVPPARARLLRALAG